MNFLYIHNIHSLTIFAKRILPCDQTYKVFGNLIGFTLTTTYLNFIIFLIKN